jgi:hypothetical protein
MVNILTILDKTITMLPAAEVPSGGRIKWVEHPYDCDRGFHAETVYSRTASPNTENLEAQLRLVDRVRAMLAIASIIIHCLGGQAAPDFWMTCPGWRLFAQVD